MRKKEGASVLEEDISSVRTIEDLALFMGATISEERMAKTTRSGYRVVELNGRSVTIRASDHLNLPNPRSPEKCREASVLRSTADGFDRAFLYWLGFESRQLNKIGRGKLRTVKGMRALARLWACTERAEVEKTREE